MTSACGQPPQIVTPVAYRSAHPVNGVGVAAGQPTQDQLETRDD
jgi:hypothetical protein